MKKTAQIGLIIIFSLTIIFHILVIIRIIPYNIVWGGRLQSEKEMYRFELVSALLNMMFLFVVLLKINIVKTRISPGIINVILWFMFGLFVINTAGNILSANQMEKIIFTPVTVLLSVFSFILAFEKRP